MKKPTVQRSLLRFDFTVFVVAYLLLLLAWPNTPPVPPKSASAINTANLGNPWMNYADGAYVPTRFDAEATSLIARTEAAARTLITGDFDEDGMVDLVSGYATPTGGIVGIRTGNVDVLFPHTEAAYERNVHGTSTSAPFLPSLRLFDTGLAPDFLEAGDFNADGHMDLVTGSRASTRLHWLPGQGDGTFSPPQTIQLDGPVTAFKAGDMNRRDGLTDLAVGIVQNEKALLLIFEGPSGALQHQPEVFEMPAPVAALSIASFDAHYAIDLAVAAGSDLLFISGRDRKLSLGAKEQATVAPAMQRVYRLDAPVVDMVAGRFDADRQTDLVLLSSDGALSRFDGATQKVSETPYTFESADLALAAASVSTLPGDDLLLLDRTTSQIHIFHTPHLHQLPETPAGIGTEPSVLPVPVLAPITLDLDATPASLALMRLNGDGMMDMVVQPQSPGAVAVALSAPVATFNVDATSGERDASPGDGVCATAANACTLRAAIEEANRSAGPHTITFSVSGIQTAFTTGQLPTITEVVFIDGESFGSRVEILGDRTHLQINANVAEGSVIRGLSLGTIVTWNGARIENNHIQVNGAGTGMTDDGTGLTFNGDNNVAGGTNESTRNVIARMQISGGVNNLVQGNYIGTNSSGTASIESEFTGLDISGFDVANNTIGGTAPGAGNVISGKRKPSSNRGIGLKMNGEGHLVQGNRFGTNADGTLPLPNEGDNIQTFGIQTIGGTMPLAGNVISASSENGIRVTGSEAQGALIQGNLIGTDITGTLAMGNGGDGIYMTGGQNTVGGTIAGAGNVVSGNGGDGIRTFDLGDDAGPHTIQGNRVGTDITGTGALGNGGDGLEVGNEQGSTIGGDRAEATNIFAYNAESGVRVSNRDAVRHRINGNSIFANGELGIKLGAGNRVENNDTGDADTGSNNEQNYPELSTNADGTLHVSLNSMAGQTYRVEFFGNPDCDTSGHGEGHVFLQAQDVTTDASGNTSFDVSLVVLKGQEIIAATATDADGNTSEFSVCAEVEAIIPLVVQVMQDSLNHNPMPIANTAFQIAQVDFSDPADPFTFVDTQFTDANGFLPLSKTDFSPGDPFLLRTRAAQVPSVKAGHEDVDNLRYEVLVDNLHITRQGRIEPDTLFATENDTTITYLGHTSLKYNFVVSIEWAASDAYIVALAQAFANANNLLYDITNGQAYFDKVAIYDDMRNWSNAEMRIHADNTSWPRANVFGIEKANRFLYFPPKHYGSKSENINKVFEEDVLDPNTFTNFSTVVHELGHYAFGFYDEYQDSLDVIVHPFINFGFMDSHYSGNGISSEMSAFVSSDYRDTEQYQRNRKPTWEFFHDTFSASFGDVRAEIHTPERLGLTSNQLISGPNESLSSPDLDVGDMTDFVLRTSSANDPRPSFLLMDIMLGQPAAGILVALQKQDTRRWITQGKTVLTGSNRGKIRPLGLRTSDRLVATSVASKRYLFIQQEINALAAGKQMEDIILNLTPVSGNITLLPAALFDGDGDLMYQVQSNTPFSTAPTLDVIQEGSTANEQALAGTAPDYSLPLNEVVGGEAVLLLQAPDEAGQTFPVPQRLSVFDVSATQTTLVPEEGNIELFLEPGGLGINQMSVLSSPFPVPTTGLPDSVRQVSALYAVNTAPSAGAFAGTLKLYYDADSLLASVPDAVTIYRWADSWQPLPTFVNSDTLAQSASVEIDQGGWYAAYLDLNRATRTSIEGGEDDLPDGSPRGFLLHPNYPNPFGPTTTLAFDLSQPAQVTLKVYNVIGQEVAVVAEGMRPPGNHAIAFDARNLPPGVYFYQLQVGNERAVRSMIRIR